MKQGDKVAIRGDKRINHLTKQSVYLPEQLIDGKYVKHKLKAIWNNQK